MSGIGFELKAILGERDDPVENPELFAIAIIAHAAVVLDLEVLSKLGFVPIEVPLETQGCEDVSMDNNRHVAAWMVEAAWRSAP